MKELNVPKTSLEEKDDSLLSTTKKTLWLTTHFKEVKGKRADYVSTVLVFLLLTLLFATLVVPVLPVLGIPDNTYY